MQLQEKLTYTTEDSEDYEIILVQDRNNDWKSICQISMYQIISIKQKMKQNKQ